MFGHVLTLYMYSFTLPVKGNAQLSFYTLVSCITAILLHNDHVNICQPEAQQHTLISYGT